MQVQPIVTCLPEPKHTSALLRLSRVMGALLIIVLTLLGPLSAAHADDGMFPAAPQARAAIDFDGKGFLIHGQRTFIASAGMEYARVPRALWADRLMRIKRAGLNCVEIYTFWNYHEPQDGKFDFTGDHDLDAFLKLAKTLDLYVIARVGPYYCAEWDSGGYPLWLRFKPGVQVREDNPQFEHYVDRFFDKLLPIISANQINHGGSVILVQLENEDPQGWGTAMPNAYFTHLRDKALADGIQVPYFFSGLHHAADPAGRRPWDSVGRANPWISTEFWSVWFNRYGENAGDVATYDRRTWKIIAYGGNGYNYYMFHGGTNFGYTNDNEDAASYDYGAAVGQAGDLRPLFYTFKRAAWFASSFASVLENSTNASDAYQSAATESHITVTARKSPAGTILFLDNPTTAPVQTQISDTGGALSASGPLTVEAGEILPVVMDYALLPGVTIHRAPVRILGIVPQGNTTTLIIHGPDGASGEMSFVVPAGTTITPGAAGLAPGDGGHLVLHTVFHNSAPSVYSFQAGKVQRVRIMAISDAMADRTWPIEAGGKTYLVIGPAYVGEATLQSGKLRLETETPWNSPGSTEAVAYGESEVPLHMTSAAVSSPEAPAPALTGWEHHPADAPTASQYDDSGWLTSQDPLQMAADGDTSCYAWYRSSLNVPTAGSYSLVFNQIGDMLALFVDGQRVPDAATGGLYYPLTLTAGTHSLAAFTEHFGRDKLYNHLGAIDMSDPKGISGPVSLVQTGGDSAALTDWRVMIATGRVNDNSPQPADDAPGWTAIKTGDDPFHQTAGVAWFRVTLPEGSGGGGVLHLAGIHDHGTLFLNGKRIGHSDGADRPLDLPLGSAWQQNGPNVLTILVRNDRGAGGIIGPATLTQYRTQVSVTGWKLRGGPGDPLASTGWTPLAAGTTGVGPAFYRASFTTTPPGSLGPHPILRVTFQGLAHGSIWLNGHNLGRYPEKIPIDGLYLPECWLTTGTNSLVIYDDAGSSPAQVALQVETAASRYGLLLIQP